MIIAGSRQFSDYQTLSFHCDRLLAEKRKSHRVVIISGTCRGADQLGERYAEERGVCIEKFPADWNSLGKSAGPVRNAQMANAAHALVAFWDGKSRGTGNMIDVARTKGLKIRIVSL